MKIEINFSDAKRVQQFVDYWTGDGYNDAMDTVRVYDEGTVIIHLVTEIIHPSCEFRCSDGTIVADGSRHGIISCLKQAGIYWAARESADVKLIHSQRTDWPWYETQDDHTDEMLDEVASFANGGDFSRLERYSMPNSGVCYMWSDNWLPLWRLYVDTCQAYTKAHYRDGDDALREKCREIAKAVTAARNCLAAIK